MFNIIENIELEDRVVGALEYTEELLKEYLEDIKTLEGETPGLPEYLKALKNGDILDNQNLEKENSFLIGIYMQLSRESAIDKLIKYKNNSKQLTEEDIYDLHNTLLYGTSSEGKPSLRTTNEKFVGRFQNGQRIIDYFPIDCKEVPEAVRKIANLYNQRYSEETFNNIFIHAFIIHGLIGALQIFEDGNTRIGRVMQHALIWQYINERTEFTFELPPIYATRNYYPYRGTYRGLISRLVKENSNEAWNEWFDFNLKRIQDQIYKNNENLYEFKRNNAKKRTLKRY